MAANGRPTPQPNSPERPAFRDRQPEDYRNPEANPFVTTHREFGLPLLPASEAWTYRGRWQDTFDREAPLWLEIGCGNGFFLRDVALAHPEANIVGIEIRYKRTVMCAKKLVAAEVTNARICRYHAGYLDDLFEPGALQRIFVNHPDPWPKERHEKNRLISRWFLEDVVRYLAPGGIFQLKSDFPPNVERVEALLDHDEEGNPAERLPLEIRGMSEDIARDGAPWADDVITNYQRKMALRGKRVLGIELVRT